MKAAKPALIERGPSTDEGTFGSFAFGENRTHVLELPWRENRRRLSCVPVGSYRCVLIVSPKFGPAYLLLDVPGRSEVLIHGANFGGDSTLGWDTHLHGCIAPCDRIGRLRNRFGKMQMAGLVSKPAVNRFMAWAAGQPVQLTIRNREV